MVDSVIIIVGIVCVAVIATSIICHRSRCRRVTLGSSGLVVERDTSQEHDMNLSDLRGIVPGSSIIAQHV
jgi:hypothetical protein